VSRGTGILGLHGKVSLSVPRPPAVCAARGAICMERPTLDSPGDEIKQFRYGFRQSLLVVLC
jgi:hypothetical protein